MTITIVGAGVVGCAIAWELSARGARVRILDSRRPGGGATQASAGILSPHIEALGEPLLALCLRSFELYDAFMARLHAETPRVVPYERTGTLQVARDAAEAASLEALAGELSARGVPHALLGPDDVRRVEPALGRPIAAGLLVEPHGYVSARALTAALVSAARRHGATFTRAHVREIETGADAVRVATGERTFESDIAIVAAGSWSGRIGAEPITPPPVTPVRGQLVHLRLDAPILSRVVWGTQCYLVPWRDGSVLVGATVEDAGFDERSTAGAVTQLAGAAIDLVPGLASADVRRVRVGLRPASSDGLPIVGRSSRHPRLFYATGHYRTGVLLAPLTAKLTADLILDGEEGDELTGLSPGRVGF